MGAFEQSQTCFESLLAETRLEVALGRITAGSSFGHFSSGQLFESLTITWFLTAIALERAPRDDTVAQRFRVSRLVWSAIGLAMMSAQSS
jgi:hypothetical protein